MKITPKDILDTAAWCQSEDELRDTLRQAATALEIALSASPAGVKPLYIGLKGASEIASSDLASMSAIEPNGPQCCMCGKKGLSTVEGDGGTECELSDGRWVCSTECWDQAVEPAGVGLETPPPSSHVAVTYTQAEYDEAYELGKRDGYEEAVQEIDQLTGGDGEYRVSMLIGGGVDDERHTPDAPAMIQRIVDRFETLNLLHDAEKSGRDQEWGTAPSTHLRGEPVAWRVRVKSDDPEEWSLLPAGGGADYLNREGYECQPLYVLSAEGE